MGMLKELEKRYPEGSNLTVMNTYYSYPQYDPETHSKISDDFLIIVYKNLDTMQSEYIKIDKPSYLYYKLNDDQPIPDYNKMFIEKEKVHSIEVPFTQLEKSIAKETGNEEFYNQNIANRNKAENKKLHMATNIFNSDMSIESHYRFRFDMTYKNEVFTPTVGFFDIEVDGINSVTDFVEPENCPVNCISFIDNSINKVYTFILRNKSNPLIQQFEDEIKTGKFEYKEIHQFIIEATGGNKKAKTFGTDESTFELYFYDYEIDLLRDFFATVHKSKLDFVMGWNSSGFDLKFIIERIYCLGYDPADIVCDQTWPVKVVKHAIDERHLNDLAERGDFTFVSGTTVWIDQLIQYASRRKAKIGSYASFKLDDIGELEGGVKKLDYSHITHSVVELPYLDFKTFVLYNIMDTMVQKCIEKVCDDINYIFSKCIINNTPYNKGHRQTVYLVNRMAKDWYKMGLIIGNNSNKWNSAPPKFLGALVHDPLKTGDYCKQKIDGRSIFIIDNMIDMDFASLYPSLIGEFNTAANTQIGRIMIPHKVYKNENAYNLENYSRSGEFIDNLVTDNIIEYCCRWFRLGNILDIISDIDDYCRKLSLPSYNDKLGTGQYDVSTLGLPNTKERISPIHFTNKNGYRPFGIYKNKPEDITYNSLLLGEDKNGN